MRRIGASLLFCFTVIIASAQDTAQKVPVPYYPYHHPFPPNDFPMVDSSGFVNPKLFQPTVGFGPSILTFYGDVRDKFTPSLSRMGFNLSLSEYVTKSLQLSARAMFGKVAGNER